MDIGTKTFKPRASRLNLLRIPIIRRLILWSGFPYVFQAVVLAVFIILAGLGWGYLTPEGVNAKLYAKTNLVNLAIWGLWWPAIIWVTVLLGRAWCVVCPLELVSNGSERLGRRLGLRQKNLPSWLARGGLVICLFALLQMLVPGIQIHRVPAYTSIFLWTMLAGAFVVGLCLKDCAFCRGFCPVALLLNAYGRGSMLAVRAGSDGPCETCSDRACIDKAGRHKPDARSCPSLLNPPKLNNSKDCLICGQCLKACTPDNMELVLRAPYSREDARETSASWPLTLFVMIVSGFVTYELCGVWKAADPVFLWVPRQVSGALNAGGMAGWIQGVWTVIVVPLAIWLVLGAAHMAFGGPRSLGEAWRQLALPAAVIVAAGHLAKGIEKFTSWAGFLPYALSEPTGLETAVKMNAAAMPQPSPWLGLPVLSVIAMLLVGVAVPLAVREARLASADSYPPRVAPLAILGAFYFFLCFGWGGWLA